MKENEKVRLLSITIENLKNVGYGKIDFPQSEVENGFSDLADVVGIYGQNGSGKTTVIQALSLFKRIATRQALWTDILNCINIETSLCSLVFRFAIQIDDKKFYSEYFCEISKLDDSEIQYGFTSEKLSLSKIDEKENVGRLNTVFEYSKNNDNSQPFNPKYLFESIVNNNQQKLVNCLLSKQIAFKEHKSFLFSQDFYSLLAELKDNELAKIIKTLCDYASYNLFTITNEHSGMISTNSIIPVAIKHKSNVGLAIGDIPIFQQVATVSDIKTYSLIKNVLTSINCVIKALIPDLSITIKEYGSELLKNGTEGIRYEVVSERDNKQIPIRYESEGIRKLLSVLNLIIVAYNNSSVCVAIDELDAGIFESLLGDLIKVFAESGKGQIVFTSHNLRPLEVLEKRNIVFTTSNKSNRYIFLKNIRKSNNLRDCYLRALLLGGQDEELATETDTVLIRRAFHKAGMING